MDAIRSLIDEERLGAVVTVVDGPGTGERTVIDRERGVVVGSAGDIEGLVEDANQLMDHEQNRTLEYEEVSVYIETVAPQPHLIIFGAVHIAQELCRIAHQLGYRVTVADARPAFTTQERFPEAAEVLVGWPGDLADKIGLDPRTYVVLLSHDSRFEDPLMPMVLKSPAKYIGAMGSRRTHRTRVERLTAEGWSEADVDRIHGPVGLDIGAEQPGEVAISILAEMIQVRYGSGTGESLVGRAGRIHMQRTEDDGDV